MLQNANFINWAARKYYKNQYILDLEIEFRWWHFSNIKTPQEIEHKLKSYLHHREFDVNPLSLEEIKNIIKNKQAIYDLKVDKKVNKIGNGSELEEYPLSKLPSYLQENKEKYKLWLNWNEKRLLDKFVYKSWKSGKP